MLKPINDLCKVLLESDEYGFGSADKDTAESGILEEVPDQLYYYGFWSFAFENSFMDAKSLEQLVLYWKSKIGRRVYWTALSERGNILEQDGKKYAFIKFTSLIADDEAESNAISVHKDGAGSFGLEK